MEPMGPNSKKQITIATPHIGSSSMLLNEARRIGDQLLAEAKTDSCGMYWETMNMDTNRCITFEKSESIYSGVSGIVLFMLELYKQTRAGKYMDAATEGMRWVIDYCQKNPSQYYAFFTGRMGVSYTLLKMFEATGESHYLEKALATAQPCIGTLEGNGIDDLINGTAGTLLGLLHLHAASGETWILEAIDGFIKNLIHHAHPGPVGLYWDRSPQSISGLCGFSHGAAGIGFVFLELGRYFQNDSFLELAEQAFLYERHFFDKEKLNWPDLRKGIYSDEDYQEHKKAFLEKDPEFFTRGGDMNAWCHGAAGTGLSRLRAFQLLNEPVYKKEALAAIEKTSRTDIECDVPTSPLFILCHGGGGNAELFLYAYQILDENRYLSMAEKIAHKAIAFHRDKNYYHSGFRGKDNDNREDLSLFMGVAGIGYFLLRLLAPHDVPSILIPKIDAALSPGQSLSQYPFITVSPADVREKLVQKHFIRTVFMSGKIIPGKLSPFFDTGGFQTDAFIHFMEGVIPSLSGKEKEILSDIFDLECEKWRMDKAVKSHALLATKDKVLAQQGKEALPAENESFLQLMLQLEPDIRIGTTQWNWNPSRQKEWAVNLDIDPDTWAVLLKPGPLGVIETELSPFSYTILSEFREPRRVADVIPVTIDAFEALTPDQEEMLKEKIIGQVKQALVSGILIRANS